MKVPKHIQQVLTIDLKNLRYQGCLSPLGQRHGFGIVLDDQMTLYCSQWERDKLNGDTFIFQKNHSFLYGTFNKNEVNGVNVFRNNNYIIIGNYLNAKPSDKAIAIDSSLFNVISFNPTELFSMNDKKDLICTSFKQTLQKANFQTAITQISLNYGIVIEKSLSSLFQFLKRIHKKYKHVISFSENEGLYHFGYKNGLGFSLFIGDRVHQKISPFSIGSYSTDKTIQYGLKFHNQRCFEQGNFKTRETITYNCLKERPQQKCMTIYQKIHKNSLNFVNVNCSLSNILSIFQTFQQKLDKKFQYFANELYQKKRIKQFQKEIKKNSVSQTKLNQQDHLSRHKQKYAIGLSKNDKQTYERKKSDIGLQNKKLTKSILIQNQMSRQAKIKQNQLKIREQLFQQQKRILHQPLTHIADQSWAQSSHGASLHEFVTFQPPKSILKYDQNSYQRALQEKINNIQIRRLKLLNQFKQLNQSQNTKFSIDTAYSYRHQNTLEHHQSYNNNSIIVRRKL